jgi:nucleoside-diphosphate-sugar epimerase
LQLPSFSVAVGDMAAAVRRAGGEEAYARIRWEPDPQIQRIISSWPKSLLAPRAEALGYSADNGIDEVVQAFIEDDLDNQKQLAAV